MKCKASASSIQPFHLAFPVRSIEEARKFYGGYAFGMRLHPRNAHAMHLLTEADCSFCMPGDMLNHAGACLQDVGLS